MLGFTVRVSFRQCPWSFLLKTGTELWPRLSFCFVLKFPDWKWLNLTWLSLYLILTDVLQILLCLNVCHWYIPFGARQRWRLHVWHLLIIIVTMTACVDECMYLCAHCMWVCISVGLCITQTISFLWCWCVSISALCHEQISDGYNPAVFTLWSHLRYLFKTCYV